MIATELEPPQNREDILAFLKESHPTYQFDPTTTAHKIGEAGLIALIGPTAAGKSTLLKEVIKTAPEIRPMGSTMTRPARINEAPYNRNNVPIEVFRDAVLNRSIVDYFVSDTEEVYGSFPDQFSAPLTIGEVGYDTITQLETQPFRGFWPIYTLMAGDVYAARIELDRIRDTKVLGRITEGLASLDFAEDNHKDGSIHYIELDNLPGSLALNATIISSMVRQNTRPFMAVEKRKKRINEMRGVLLAARRRIGVY